MSYIANINGDTLPPFMPKVCQECPWRKVDNVNQHHPVVPEGVFRIAEKHIAMSCHMSQHSLQAYSTEVRRCRGIEIFRANTGIESEFPADCETVFASKEEALNRWPKVHTDWKYERERYFKLYPDSHWLDENKEAWVAGKRVDTKKHLEECARCKAASI